MLPKVRYLDKLHQPWDVRGTLQDCYDFQKLNPELRKAHDQAQSYSGVLRDYDREFIRLNIIASKATH
jgi:hypothetical protein